MHNFTSSRTCPTCRDNQNLNSLTKLYFEFDDSKANLNIEDVLKTNEELTKEMKKLQEATRNAEEKLREMESAVKNANGKSKFLERQKQLDDMAIAGLKDIKDESTKEIIKLNGWMKSLKLDLLAEKQLRRMLQQKLHDIDPQNENYNTANILIDESRINETSMDVEAPTFRPIVPFWKLNCEAKKAEKETKSFKTPYIIPSKIQRATNASKEPQSQLHQKNIERMMKNCARRIPAARTEAKPIGFQFHVPSNVASSSQPSTSTSSSPAVPGKIQKRFFGEGKPLFEILPSSTSPSTSSSSAFKFSIDAPTFQPLGPSGSSTPPITVHFSSLLRNYRDHNEISPRENVGSSATFNNANGPKISDR